MACAVDRQHARAGGPCQLPDGGGVSQMVELAGGEMAVGNSGRGKELMESPEILAQANPEFRHPYLVEREQVKRGHDRGDHAPESLMRGGARATSGNRVA